MNIPQNGRVVIIDDEVEKEGMPLVKTLTKNNISTIFFTGDIEELPTKPFKGIRIVFLDIVLGTYGQSEKTHISKAVNVMKRIIDVNNGPYLLIAWTKHNELIDKLKEKLVDIPPIHILNLEKNTCKNNDGKFSVLKISRKIKNELNKVSSFHVFALWENLVHQAAGEIVNDFSSFYEIDDQWDKNMSSVFFRLAKAYVGKKSETMKSKQILQNALLTFNGAFIDTLENKIRNKGMSQTHIERNIISNEITAAINKKLMLFFDDNIKKPEPGNVYSVKNNFGVKFDLQEICVKLSNNQKEDLLSKAKYIFLEASPSCDFAQNNWRIHRCVSGVMWPIECMKKLKKSDFMYKTPKFEIDNNLYILVFNLRYLTTLPLNKLNNKKALFRIRHNLLVDIQSYISRHINRPGVISI